MNVEGMKIMYIKNNFLLLLLGNVTSKIGNTAYNIILSIWILEVFNSSKILGEIKTYIYIPMVILNLFSGYLADRYNKKYILIITDFISAFSCMLFYFLGSSYYGNVYFLVLLNIILIINTTFFSPSLRSIIPEIISKDKIKKLNAILTASTELTRLFVPAVSVFIYKLKIIDFSGILIFNGITFMISAILEMLIEYNYDKETKIKKEKAIKGILTGFNYIFNRKYVFILLVYAFFLNVVASALELLVPYYFSNINISNLYLTFTISAQSLSALLASTSIIFIKSRFKFLNFKNIILLQIIPFTLLLLNYKLTFLISIFINTFLIVLFNILFFSYIQETTEKEYMGRLFSTIYFIAGLGIPLGSLIFSKIFLEYTKGIFLVFIYVLLISIFFYYLLRNEKERLKE